MRILYSIARNRLASTEEIKARSREFQKRGLSLFDSLHIALAEAYKQDAFLTTDDKLCRAAAEIHTGVRVANPVIWFMEVEE